jgi:hypothetical protein
MRQLFQQPPREQPTCDDHLYELLPLQRRRALFRRILCISQVDDRRRS